MPGYDVVLVEPVKEGYLCPHCRLLLRDPIQNQDGFRICQDCCNLIKEMPGGKCPNCGITILPDSEIYLDRAAKKEIDSLLVYCTNKSTGCQWTGKLALLDAHLQQCAHKGVTCPNRGCGVVISADKLELHKKECHFRQVECEYCNALLPYCGLTTHHQTECELCPQPCEQCGDLVTKRDLSQHLECSCPFIKCRGCQALVDRETSKEVVDGELGEPHLCNPKTTFDHMQNLIRRFEGLARDSDSSSKHEHLKENTTHTTKILELEMKLDEALVKVNRFESGTESEGIISMKKLLQEMQRTISSQNKKIEGQSKEIVRLTSRLDEVMSAQTTKNGLVRLEREEYPRTVGFSTQDELTSEPSYADSKLLQVMKSVEELQRTTTMMKVHMSELELQLQASLASTHTGSFLWRIPEVARRKRDAFEGRITSIYSPPFYSGRNGYKMCIRAYLNGDGIGFNTHLSVFFVLMKGEYDPLLKWPFECKVSLILVDQNMRQHVIQTFKPSPESSSFQRPRSDMNVASGCPQFAKLSVLDEGNYVKNDIMFLKCIVDTSKILHP